MKASTCNFEGGREIWRGPDAREFLMKCGACSGHLQEISFLLGWLHNGSNSF